MNPNHKQQGDVLLKRVAKIPATAKRLEPGRRGHVLAHGETGHAHVIKEATDDVELYREGERLLAHVLKTATVTHEEHGSITLEPGVWEVGGVAEENEFGDMRQVVD